MTAFFDTQDRSNRTVLASAGDVLSVLASQLAIHFHRGARKQNSGSRRVLAKPAAPWYRRFDKR
jgi:hypothetical protein